MTSLETIRQLENQIECAHQHLEDLWDDRHVAIEEFISNHPDWVSPPGDTISDILEERDWPQVQLADYLGYSIEFISQLINGETPINEETALKLEEVLGSTAAFWLRCEAQYRAALAKKEGTISKHSSKGKLIVVSGPSSVGKDSLVTALLTKYPNIHLSISTTTRVPRKGEVDGLDYYFITRDEFNDLINKGEFLEWAEYNGNLYGTSKRLVSNYLSKGQSVILIIEVVGAGVIRTLYPSATFIFIKPPSLKELEGRIRDRGLDSEEAIKSRMERARVEIEEASNFDYVVVNDYFDKALSELSKIVEEIIS